VSLSLELKNYFCTQDDKSVTGGKTGRSWNRACRVVIENAEVVLLRYKSSRRSAVSLIQSIVSSHGELNADALSNWRVLDDGGIQLAEGDTTIDAAA